METLNEKQIKAIGIILCIASAVYFGLYFKANEYPTTAKNIHLYETEETKFYNGEVLMPDHVHADTLQVVNADLLNDIIISDTTGLIQSYEDINEVLQEGCVNVADYNDYIKAVVSK